MNTLFLRKVSLAVVLLMISLNFCAAANLITVHYSETQRNFNWIFVLLGGSPFVGRSGTISKDKTYWKVSASSFETTPDVFNLEVKGVHKKKGEEGSGEEEPNTKEGKISQRLWKGTDPPPGTQDLFDILQPAQPITTPDQILSLLTGTGLETLGRDKVPHKPGPHSDVYTLRADLISTNTDVINQFRTEFPWLFDPDFPKLPSGQQLPNTFVFQFSGSHVPEPGSLMLLSIGVLCLGLYGWHRRNQAASGCLFQKKIDTTSQRKEVSAPARATWRYDVMPDKEYDPVQQLPQVAPLMTCNFYQELSHIATKRRTVLAEIERMPLVKPSKLDTAVARGIDILLSVLGLLACAIPFLVIGIAIKLDSKGPVFFRQMRVGKSGKPFRILKFRTMVDNAEGKSGPVWEAKGNDSRITRVGAFLRGTKLDELPQLVNIFLGDMTFVGPRPERPEFVHWFVKCLPAFSRRHEVKPGLTGLAQLRNGYDDSAASVYRKLRWDVRYLKRKCLRTDLAILYQTLRYVMSALKNSIKEMAETRESDGRELLRKTQVISRPILSRHSLQTN